MKQEICVGDQEGGLRIDKYLAEAAGQLSRSYIQKLLKDYGYAVSRQRFRQKTEHAEIIGTNVTAAREAEDPDADILLVCTWHDSLPDSPGAGKNASGVSVFMGFRLKARD